MATVLAATSMAGASRKPSVSSDCASRDFTSRASASSPPEASSTKAAQRLLSSSNAEWYNCLILCHRSASTGMPLGQFATQPTFSELPVSLHRFHGDLEHLGC